MEDLRIVYKKLGLNIIPCKPKSKEPAVNWREFQLDRYTGPISKDQNIAVICGKISNNLAVIDIDAPELINKLFDDFEGLKKKTLVVQTGSGGFHIYVKADKLPPTMRLTNSAKQHIDIQSDKTYVIAPPSIHPNGEPYRVISSTTDINKIDLDGFIKSLSAFGFDTTQAMMPIIAIAKGVSKGDRNNSLFKYSCHLMGTLEFDPDTAWHEIVSCNNRNVPPLDERELKILFKSAKDRISKSRPELFKNEKITLSNISEISAVDESKTVIFDSFIAAVDEHKGITTDATVLCPHCAQEKVVHSEFQNILIPHCTCKYHPKMIVDEKTRQITDARVVLFQQLEESVRKGAPARFIGRLVGQLALSIFVGQKVRVTGTLKLYSDHKSRESEFNIHVKSVEDLEEQEDVTMSDEKIAYLKIDKDWLDKLSECFATHIYGYKDIKKTLLLTLIGGSKEGKRRGDINTLIVGNPSKAKSELLKFCNDITSKSSLVNGRHASAAGIAYGMVKMPNGTSIPQAGPLVKNSGGFLFIDELDKMRKDDRYALLEAMEQQTVSLAKAGVNMTVDAKTAVIAAANPKYGKWDIDETLLDNINLEPFLISRFDLIWGVIETNPVIEQRIAWTIVDEGESQKPCMFNELELRQFINYARKKRPRLTKEAKKTLVDFYVKMQEMARDTQNTLPLEARQLAGFVRLSTAHAKVHLKKAVEVEDVNAVIELYKSSLGSFGIEVKPETQQINIYGSKRLNKEQTLLHAFHALANMNELGHVSKEQLMNELPGKTKYFETAIDVAKEFDKLASKGRFLMCADDGLYRESN